MFVEGNVIPDNDVDLLEDFKDLKAKWKHHEVKRLDEPALLCRNALENPQRVSASLSSHRDLKPLMTRCSGSITYDPDTGAITISASAEFESGKNEAGSDNDAGKGTTAADNDPPDSRDRDVDKD